MKSKKSVVVRITNEARKRLKTEAARKELSLIDYVEILSKHKIDKMEILR